MLQGDHVVDLQQKTNPNRAQHKSVKQASQVDKIREAHQNMHVIIPDRRKLVNSAGSGDYMQKLPSFPVN